MNKVTVIVGTCKKYSDVSCLFYNMYSSIFKSYNQELFFLTDELIEDLPFENQIVDDSLTWSVRMANSLSKLDSEFVVFLLDDYYLLDNKLFEFLNNYDFSFDYFRIVNIPKTNDKINLVDLEKDYTINLQPSIWRKTVLIDAFLRINSSPWGTEINLNSFFMHNSSLKAGYKDCLHYNNGVIKGQWARNLIFDIPENSKRKMMSILDWRFYKLKCFMSELFGSKKHFIKNVLLYFGFSFYK